MGPRQVPRAGRRRLGAAGALAALAASGLAPRAPHAAPRRDHFAPPASLRAARGEPVALVDLDGPVAAGDAADGLGAALAAAGLPPIGDEGLRDALAGVARDLDALALEADAAEAARAFGALDCDAAALAARRLVLGGAARQAAGLPADDAIRGWTYELLCADRGGDHDRAMRAAAQLRHLGADAPGVARGVDAAVWARYPEVDAGSNREIVPVTVTADVPGLGGQGAEAAEAAPGAAPAPAPRDPGAPPAAGDGGAPALWIDHRAVPPGTVPYLPVGDHVFAVAGGGRRGARLATVTPRAREIAIDVAPQAGRWAALAARIASFRGRVASEADLASLAGEVLDALPASVGARLVVFRRGDAIEAWGRAGRGAAPRRLGADDVLRASAPGAIAALLRQRVTAWDERAPDPDVPLLREPGAPRAGGAGAPRRTEEAPARWYVYASLAGAVLLGGAVIYAHDSARDRQRVEVHVP